MGFEPTNRTLGRYCLTTWPHPHSEVDYIRIENECQAVSSIRLRAKPLAGRTLFGSERTSRTIGNGPFSFSGNGARGSFVLQLIALQRAKLVIME